MYCEMYALHYYTVKAKLIYFLNKIKKLTLSNHVVNKKMLRYKKHQATQVLQICQLSWAQSIIYCEVERRSCTRRSRRGRSQTSYHNGHFLKYLTRYY